MSVNIVARISVFPKLPDTIERLQELAHNLWWSWQPDAQELYVRIDSDLWTASNQNPVKFLRNVKQAELAAAASDPDYLSAYQKVMMTFDGYMDPDAETWFKRTYPDSQGEVIAYFSAEFGLHEALPIYSGGLGVLSGDHCKEASDLGLPLVGVGFLYPQGYFTQRINGEGQQEATYQKIDFAEVPATPALDPDGNEVQIQVSLPGRSVYAKIWRIQVGRVPLYLMDTDVERNAPQDRELSARLYAGDHELRISQEYVLGIGGVRALRGLGYKPQIWHMNEGHSAFLGLERIRELVQGGELTFDEAVEAVRAGSVFTTHTPVPAGHDTFGFELMEKFFWQFWGQLGISRERFLNLAADDQGWGSQFSMTVLAFRLSAYHNGVSELHGHVSRRMWQHLWPNTPVEQVPIGHITNGVHTGTWLVPELQRLYTRYLQESWLEDVDDPDTWQKLADVPDAELWETHVQCKQRMIAFVRERVRRQLLRHGEGPIRVNKSALLLEPNALTLGFARRFATYKRAMLIFWDMERIRRILKDPERPVQIIFAGKAHPADEPGKLLIQRIYQLSQTPDFAGKIVFVEDYDMNVARHLVSGVDVWLNNPRRPNEASGTSGEKAAISGNPNFSVLDGWWREAYDGQNGWAIGEEREYKEQETQDEADALSLYAVLEEEIVPRYYERDAKGVPHRWLETVRASVRTCGPQFSMRRMVKEYTNRYYMPAGASGSAYAESKFDMARQVAAWKQRVAQNWGEVRLQADRLEPVEIVVGEPIQIRTLVWLGNIAPDDVVIEVVAGKENGQGFIEEPQTTVLKRTGNQDGALVHTGQLTPDASGRLAVGIRARPHHAHLIHPYEVGLSSWA